MGPRAVGTRLTSAGTLPGLSALQGAGRQGTVLKHRNRWSLLSLARWRDIIASRTAWGSDLGLNPEFLEKILGSVHEESIRVQGDEANQRRAQQDSKGA